MSGYIAQELSEDLQAVRAEESSGKAVFEKT